jgi:hypothetical protein
MPLAFLHVEVKVIAVSFVRVRPEHGIENIAGAIVRLVQEGRHGLLFLLRL